MLASLGGTFGLRTCDCDRVCRASERASDRDREDDWECADCTDIDVCVEVAEEGGGEAAYALWRCVDGARRAEMVEVELDDALLPRRLWCLCS